LTVDEQRAYLQRHPGSRRRLTAQPPQAQTTVQPVVDQSEEQQKPAEVKPAEATKPTEPVKPVETIPAKSLTRSQIRKILEDTFNGSNGSPGYSPKKGGFVFKQGYFYRHGGSPEKFAERIVGRTKAAGLTPVVVDTRDNWNAWPKDSWFEAVVKFEQQQD
jgi:hypothetical protein